jgi:hypothetical protein
MTNKYGGWSEYNHMIFTKLWQKYFKSEQDCQLDENDLFIGEVLHMVSGQFIASKFDTSGNMLDHHKL